MKLQDPDGMIEDEFGSHVDVSNSYIAVRSWNHVFVYNKALELLVKQYVLEGRDVAVSDDYLIVGGLHHWIDEFVRIMFTSSSAAPSKSMAPSSPPSIPMSPSITPSLDPTFASLDCENDEFDMTL